MGEAYKLWMEDMAASEKYKDVKPDWVWIDDAKEAEKVSLVILPSLHHSRATSRVRFGA